MYVFNIVPDTMWPPFLWLGKVGFESDGTDRASNVEYSIRQKLGLDVRVKRVVRVKVFMYRGIEKAVHNVLKILHSKRLKGCSGWTEIFNILNVFTGIIVMIIAYGLDAPCVAVFALFIMLIPYPLDMVIFVLLLAAFEYGSAGFIVYQLINYLS